MCPISQLREDCAKLKKENEFLKAQLISHMGGHPASMVCFILRSDMFLMMLYVEFLTFITLLFFLFFV